MNLVIDAGNTATKLGVFDKDELIFRAKFESSDLDEVLPSVFSNYSISDAIVSSVSALRKQEIDILKEKCNVFWLSAETPVPFVNLYETPHTLGVDRIALTAAAVSDFPKNNVLVIDAGTCITYDFKNANEEYLGGAISPGIHMRYKAMHNQTANLPLLEIEAVESVIGSTTTKAMHVGVIEGVCGEIESITAKYKVKYEDLTVILTGGDAAFLAKRLKNTIFALPNFLLTGMNYILEFNKTR